MGKRAFITLGLAGAILVMGGCGRESKKRDAFKPASTVGTERQDSSRTGSRRESGTSQDVTTTSGQAQAVDLCYKADPFLCAIEAAILADTNDARGKDMAPLQGDGGLAFVARRWSEAQGKVKSVSHTGFPNDRYATFRAEFGMESPLFIDAENVAYTWITNRDAEVIASTLVTMWYNSPGHRANMLGDHKAMGVGVWIVGEYIFATQIFASPR